MRKRTRDLTIAGPPGLQQKLVEVMETAFPGSSTMKRGFSLNIEELPAVCRYTFGELQVSAFDAAHPPNDPHVHLVIECGGKRIVYSGDTEWTETLERISTNAHLLIAEAYFFEKMIKFHMDFKTLSQRTAGIRVQRIVLTHMSEDMLGRTTEPDFEFADDGKVFEI
jgi:phosphoribosyl 1,2-cyclic phosphodiesterase